MSQVTATPVGGNPDCHDYMVVATIDGKQQQITGAACRQPDGSWRIAEGPPDNPTQYTTVYWPPASPYYAYSEPWLWSAPIGISIGFPFFVDLHHHLHHFVHGGHFEAFVHGGHFGEFHHLRSHGGTVSRHD